MERASASLGLSGLSGVLIDHCRIHCHWLTKSCRYFLLSEEEEVFFVVFCGGAGGERSGWLCS